MKRNLAGLLGWLNKLILHKHPKNRAKSALIVGAVVFLLVTFLGGDFGFIRLYQLRHKKNQLEQQQKVLQAEFLQLELDRRLWRDNPLFVEKIAREEYGLSRPEEKIYRFKPDSLENSVSFK
jgi:cell division protein FtsB